MLRRFLSVLLSGALVLYPVSASAQLARQAQVGLREHRVAIDSYSTANAMQRDINNSYWKEGGIVTAAAAVVASAFLPLRDGRDTLFHRAIVSAVVAAIFFWPGALIGSLFPKD